MKKLFLALMMAAIVLPAVGQDKGHFFLGGTAGIGYSNYFEFTLEPIFGYEIRDWVAVGTGIGMTMAATDYDLVVFGIAEPFVRFTPWHNDLVYLDLKATGGVGFTDEVELAQVGVRPGIRFRATEHCDIAADLGLFGATYSDYNWRPSFGINGTAVGLWVVYRF